MTQVYGYQPVNTSYGYTPVGVQATPTTSPSTGTPTYSSDSYAPANNGNGNGNNTVPAEGDWQNKRAGGFKRFMHGMSNLFDSMSDWVGMGTISHYAKQQFKSHDADKSNSLDVNEFSLVSQAIGVQFEQVDYNANQSLSFGEFKTIVGDLIKTNMANTDVDGDGFLNYAEAMNAGYVVARGNTDSFTLHDSNQDQLLSRREFAGLVNDIHLIKGQH